MSVVLSALVFAGCGDKSNKDAAQYTCSMHPEIIQNHPGLCPICKMDLTKIESVPHSESTHSSHSAMEMDTKTSAPPDTPVVKAAFVKLDAEVNAHIKNVISQYMHIKDALVNSDTIEAKNGAAMLIETVRRFDNSYLPAEQKLEYDKYRNEMKEEAQQIFSTTGLEMQRNFFAGLSRHVFELSKDFSTGKKMYSNHCEMAFDNTGAIWLSETKEIKNPYMGSKMIGCGSIENVIN